jgi:hypothetical protein
MIPATPAATNAVRKRESTTHQRLNPATSLNSAISP